jgi:hypothetical protein
LARRAVKHDKKWIYMLIERTALRHQTRIWRQVALVVAMSSVCPSALATTVTATSTATILTSGSLVNRTDLRFGKIVAGATLGTVTIVSTTNTRTTTGGVQAAGGTIGAADFSALSNPGEFTSVQITLPTSINLVRTTTGAPNMLVNNFNASGSGALVLNAQGFYDFRIGATLRVAANQPLGIYTGTFTVTATFQ